ncbi:hypothetical protein FB45DRAFT_722179, partial [Roridomyces roridus]
DDFDLAEQFITAIRDATLDNSDLDADCIDRLRNPIRAPLDISDSKLRLSLDMFLATSDASQKTYEKVIQGIQKAYPPNLDSEKLLSFYQIKKKVSELSGVVPLLHDMCQNSCMAF